MILMIPKEPFLNLYLGQDNENKKQVQKKSINQCFGMEEKLQLIKLTRLSEMYNNCQPPVHLSPKM